MDKLSHALIAVRQKYTGLTKLAWGVGGVELGYDDVLKEPTLNFYEAGTMNHYHGSPWFKGDPEDPDEGDLPSELLHALQYKKIEPLADAHDQRHEFSYDLNVPLSKFEKYPHLREHHLKYVEQMPSLLRRPDYADIVRKLGVPNLNEKKRKEWSLFS